MIIADKLHDYQENNMLFNRVDANLEFLNKKLPINLIARKQTLSKIGEKCSMVLARGLTEWLKAGILGRWLIKKRGIFYTG
ncbi:MAG: hypothetical protein KKD05_11615 [Candidatus Omnitrophica bacterium]|nr:hypothetical protein [Candidatus Omnitrophota bacterium]